jgi:hypothetical protein
MEDGENMKVAIGRIVKEVIDWGRSQFIDEKRDPLVKQPRITAHLVKYTDKATTLENVAIVIRKEEDVQIQNANEFAT